MTPDDVAMLRVFAGAHFCPGAQLALPSGEVLEADEANALTAAYMPDTGPPDRRIPEHLAEMPFKIALVDYLNKWEEADRLREQVETHRRYVREMWRFAMYCAGVAVLAVAMVLWLALTYPTA